jgi:hypothetical protein
MDESKKITIWAESAKRETMAALPNLGKTRVKIVQVGADILPENLNVFLSNFESILAIQYSLVTGMSICLKTTETLHYHLRGKIRDGEQ